MECISDQNKWKKIVGSPEQTMRLIEKFFN